MTDKKQFTPSEHGKLFQEILNDHKRLFKELGKHDGKVCLDPNVTPAHYTDAAQLQTFYRERKERE